MPEARSQVCATGNTRRGSASSRTLPRFTLGMVVLAGLGLWWYGGDYYTLPLDQRPDAPLHPVLDPTGSLGHPLGMLGTAMLLGILVYSLRKNLRFLQRVGTLRQWLSVHIFFGLMGPLLVTFHTGFKVEGLVAIAYWSMMVAMLSGIFGRYIYIQIPRTATGDRASLDSLQEEQVQLEAQLRQQLGGEPRLYDQIQALLLTGRERELQGWGALAQVARQDLSRPFIRRRLVGMLKGHSHLHPDAIRQVVHLAQRKAILARRLATIEAMDKAFHYWHVFHRPFAWIMLVIAAVHIGVALLLGYTGT
ncbi:MAG: hypothetical protein IT369_03650 [Candidatus Latescibacteria bacterium]|nr:hypothetical protein [Candidatus Latescibacterota bacterium]